MKLITKCISQVREQKSLRMKGKLGITSAGSGSGKFNQKFMRSITMSPGGATWQVCSPFSVLFFWPFMTWSNSIISDVFICITMMA